MPATWFSWRRPHNCCIIPALKGTADNDDPILTSSCICALTNDIWFPTEFSAACARVSRAPRRCSKFISRSANSFNTAASLESVKCILTTGCDGTPIEDQLSATEPQAIATDADMQHKRCMIPRRKGPRRCWVIRNKHLSNTTINRHDCTRLACQCKGAHTYACRHASNMAWCTHGKHTARLHSNNLVAALAAE